MNFLNSWLQGIIVSVIITTIIEMILPSGNSKKYIKVVLGVFILFTIISPIIEKVSNNRLDVSQIFNTKAYLVLQEKIKSEASAIKWNYEDIKKSILQYLDGVITAEDDIRALELKKIKSAKITVVYIIFNKIPL